MNERLTIIMVIVLMGIVYATFMFMIGTNLGFPRDLVAGITGYVAGAAVASGVWWVKS